MENFSRTLEIMYKISINAISFSFSFLHAVHKCAAHFAGIYKPALVQALCGRTS